MYIHAPLHVMIQSWHSIFSSRSSLFLLKVCRVQIRTALSSKSCCNPVAWKRLRAVARKSLRAHCQHSGIQEISKVYEPERLLLSEIIDGLSFHESSTLCSIFSSSFYLLHAFQIHATDMIRSPFQWKLQLMEQAICTSVT